MRVAGIAELNGYNTELNERRCYAPVCRFSSLFPGAVDTSRSRILDRTASSDARQCPADRTHPDP